MSQLALASFAAPQEETDPSGELDRRPHRPARRFVAPTRDLVALYAARVEKSGVDISPALRERRASLPSTGQPVLGYLAAPVPHLNQPMPVGRGTMTHRQALSELAAAKWAANTERLPLPVPVRLTHPVGSLPRLLQPRTAASPAALAPTIMPDRSIAPRGRFAALKATLQAPVGGRRRGAVRRDATVLGPTSA